jgi:hypothetical protein
MRVSQSRAELVQHLREQLQFLESSGRSYDSGFEGEAKRLAVVLRVLLHDTAQSHSLLGSLGVKSTLQFHDVIGPVPSNVVVFAGLGMGFSNTGLRYHPKLGDPKQRIPFEAWWSGLILVQQVTGVRFDRRQAVLALANMDGGAHVDPSLDPSYAALSRNNAFGWEVWHDGAQAGVDNSPALPIVRQIAHEVVGTLREQFREAAP